MVLGDYEKFLMMKMSPFTVFTKVTSVNLLCYGKRNHKFDFVAGVIGGCASLVIKFMKVRLVADMC